MIFPKYLFSQNKNTKVSFFIKATFNIYFNKVIANYNYIIFQKCA